MKKLFIVLLTVLVFACASCATVNANERAERFAVNSGLGFSAGQGLEMFEWAFGGDYWFTDMISINLELGMFAGNGAFLFQFAPRVRFWFDMPVDGLELFADGGFGYFVGDADDWIMMFGGGAYWFFLFDNNFGLGSNLDFSINGISGARFNIQWAIVSAMWRF